MAILCIGDSLTYGYGVDRNDTWCALASKLTGHDFLNRGVNGATTGEMLDQFLAENELFGRDNAISELFVMGGLNDLFMGMPIRIPLTNIHAICEHARRIGLRPIVGIPAQISSELDDGWCDGPINMGKVRAFYAEFAEQLLRRCAADGIDFIDFRPVLGPSDLSFDGIHLNRQGHQHMAEAVATGWNSIRA